MSTPDYEVLHLVAEDTSVAAVAMLERVCACAALGRRQHVVMVGPGRPPTLSRPVDERIHCPWAAFRNAAFERSRRRRRVDSAAGTQIVHAWSQDAAAWVGPYATGDRPVLVFADGDCDFRRLAGLIAERPVAALCPCAASYQAARRAGIPVTRLRLVRHPLPDVARPEPARAAARTRFGFEDSDVVLAVLPPIERATGAYIAAWGAMLAEKVEPRLRCVVAAGGRECGRVRRLVDACGGQRVVRFAADTHGLGSLLARCDFACFLPTRGTSTYALAAAVAAGRPVLATRHPVVAEFVPDERFGWLVEAQTPEWVARTLTRMIADPEGCARRAEDARARMSAVGVRGLSTRSHQEPLEATLADIYRRLAERRPVATAPPAAASITDHDATR